MSNGFTRRREQSKEEIRTAAFALFSQFGVEKVSIAAIARKAGVSQATIYNNFGSKDALARQYVAAAIDQLVSQSRQVLSNDRPYWEKLSAFLAFIAGMLAQPKTAGMDLPTFVTSADLLDDPDIRRIRDMAQEQMILLLLNLVQEGKQQGHIPPDLSDEAFRIYFRAFLDIFAAPQVRRLSFQHPQLVQHLSLLMVHGICGSPIPPP